MNRVCFRIFFKIFYYLISFQDILFNEGTAQFEVVIILTDTNVLLYLFRGNACMTFWKCNDQFFQFSREATEVGANEIGQHGSGFRFHVDTFAFHIRSDECRQLRILHFFRFKQDTSLFDFGSQFLSSIQYAMFMAYY